MRTVTRLWTALQRTAMALFLTASATGASAAVVYEFTGTVGSPTQVYGTGRFTYTAPDFIVTDVTVPGGSLDECQVTPATANCNAAAFLPNYFAGYDAIGFSFLNTGFHLFYFVDGAFSRPGVYGPAITTIGNLATLVVREVSTVPEPQSLGMLVLCLAAILSIHLRLRRAAPRMR